MQNYATQRKTAQPQNTRTLISCNKKCSCKPTAPAHYHVLDDRQQRVTITHHAAIRTYSQRETEKKRETYNK